MYYGAVFGYSRECWQTVGFAASEAAHAGTHPLRARHSESLAHQAASLQHMARPFYIENLCVLYVTTSACPCARMRRREARVTKRGSFLFLSSLRALCERSRSDVEA